ncbi:leucine zipper putative tumor suppressor 3 [Hypomesus transpacificus]|uniref:leucine zipper putative tumor suppressor 3 n=1 Tax=Hypomesus transpacificus TaxID=137520 RepID=UPI001F072BAD|nr:leucine zipper putative tumor suppressor 3 [Hypomesus transpacificus]
MGSSVASEVNTTTTSEQKQEATMRSVGTRTTQNSLPRAPPPPPSSSSSSSSSSNATSSNHRGWGAGLEDRSYNSDHPSQPPLTHAKGITADERTFAQENSAYYSTDRPPPHEGGDRNKGAAHNNVNQVVSNGIRAVSNGNRAVTAGGNGDRQVSNSAFVNGGARSDGRDMPRGALSLDICGNNVVSTNNDKNSRQHMAQYKEAGARAGAKLDNHNNPSNVLPMSGKLEQVQSNDGLVRPSAFKPVVPKSFHSMQNLVCPPQTGGGVGGGGGGHSAGGGPPSMPGPLRNTDSPGSRGGTRGGGGGGRGGGQGCLSDSGRNSLTSLPTYAGSSSGYGPPPILGPLSASTSHINRLGATGALDKMDKPGPGGGGASGGGGGGYQNGLSASDSGHSSSGKSSSSYQRMSHLSDVPGPLRPSPSSDDVIQDLEDRLWEREQEVLHMRRNLDQSEAAIVQVFEEKQRVWERQMDELRQNYASRLQQVTRRAQRSQSALQAQISRLSQEKRCLQEEMAALLAQREDLERKCLDYRKEQADILPRIEETKWEVCQKAGEISLLKQQLRESQAEVTQRAGEMVALRGQLKELNVQLKEREDAMLGLKDSYTSKTLELDRCEVELQKTLKEVSLLRDKLGVFEAEVLGLKQALGELSMGGGGGVEAIGGGKGGSRGTSRTRGGLPSPHSPQEASAFSYPALPPPPVPPPDAMLSLQSDEAKASWEEAVDLRRQLERLQGELRLERQQRERQALNFKKERHTWMDEKERVLKYQAQLQLSYVETLQKNQALELRVGQLGGRLSTSSSIANTHSTSTSSPPPGLALGPIPLPAPATPLPTLSLSLSPPPITPEDKKPPSLHQLAPPWPVSTRLERIESTEI